jgi:hypothetical protein
MWGRGIGLRPETMEAVEMVRKIDQGCELSLEEVVGIADWCGACPDAVLLLSRFVMSCDDLDYVSFSKRYDLGPMTIWSREAARAVLALGVPLDGAEFRDADHNALSPDDLYWIGYGGLDAGMQEISEAEDVLGLMQDCPSVEEQAEPWLQRAA